MDGWIGPMIGGINKDGWKQSGIVHPPNCYECPLLAVRVQIKRCELTVCAGGPSVLPESRVTSGPDPDSHTLLYPTQPELKRYS